MLNENDNHSHLLANTGATNELDGSGAVVFRAKVSKVGGVIKIAKVIEIAKVIKIATVA